MARAPNPYLADAGQYNGIAEGVNNLANVFMNSGPDPAKAAQAQAYAWRGRESRENVMDAQDARQGRFQLGDTLQNFDPAGDNRELFTQGIGSGAMDVDGLGKLMLAMNANFGGSDEQVGRSLVGTGSALGEDDFMSLDDREMGRQRNSDNRIREDRAVMSLDQRLGDAFGRGQMSLEDIYGAKHPDRYANAAETRGEGGAGGGGPFGLSPDQNRYLDAQGTMRDELGPILQGYGVPTDGDGNLRTDLLPPGYFEGVMQQATDAARADNFTRDISFYLDNAVRSQEQVPSGYTDDDNMLWGLGSEKLEMGAPQQGPDQAFGALFGGQQNTPVAQPRPTPAQPVAPAPGGDPTLQEAAEAVAQGADPAAVRERLFQMGYTDDQLAGGGL